MVCTNYLRMFCRPLKPTSRKLRGKLLLWQHTIALEHSRSPANRYALNIWYRICTVRRSLWSLGCVPCLVLYGFLTLRHQDGYQLPLSSCYSGHIPTKCVSWWSSPEWSINRAAYQTTGDSFSYFHSLTEYFRPWSGRHQEEQKMKTLGRWPRLSYNTNMILWPISARETLVPYHTSRNT